MGNRRLHRRRWCIAAIVSLLLVISLYQLWLVWPSLVVDSIQWQREVNAQLADLLYDAKANPLIAGGYLSGFSFLYGMLHSLGPGHGKVIVTTYLATHPTKIKASLMLTVISAFCQALVAIALVSVLVWGFSASMRAVNQKAMLFVLLSFALVAILGGLICWKAIKHIYRSMHHSKLKVTALTPLAVRSSDEEGQFALKPAVQLSALPSAGKSHLVKSHHNHHDGCGCGHQHVADAEAINRASTWREYIGIVATIGIRPCTGAIMVLLFANIVGLYWMGVVSAIVMAAGTAFTTSLIAMMTLTGKHLVKRYLMVGNSRGKGDWNLAGYYLQFLGGVLLIVIGLLLMGGQDYGISPMFSM
ncbi:nickel/cobalt transporter [Photobacterium sp. OFAV2-7]|uniref:nickel/cobalt transporter n=1 Tax=Photobacterium sp. OFAV2-7 TaxID=2917748 RepID=UPI001EF4AC37|nr:nickel/cobalt transporter [Photobacterium sp. OFAV2-7]MCG7585517.1 nickel/cobalt transporter [Photobacterium sp. OFAV2-7]